MTSDVHCSKCLRKVEGHRAWAYKKENFDPKDWICARCALPPGLRQEPHEDWLDRKIRSTTSRKQSTKGAL